MQSHGLQHACQSSLSLTISQSLPRSMSTELLMPSNHLIFCHLLLLPSIRVFSNVPVRCSHNLFRSDGQSIGASASASVLPIQCWFPLGLTGLISLLPTGLSRVFSSIIVERINSLALCLPNDPGGGNGKLLQYSCHENHMNNIKRQKDTNKVIYKTETDLQRRNLWLPAGNVVGVGRGLDVWEFGI